ncbi:MAG: phospholipase D family protein [Saprospiraceae bacterium]
MRHLIFLFLLVLFSCKNDKKTTEAVTTDFCAKIHRVDTTSLSKALAPYETVMKSKTGVYVLEDGGESLVSRAWFSEYAEKTIDIQYFIFSTDNVGLIACDYIVRAADSGVKLRILVDDIMLDAGIEDLLVLDAHENISIKVYNPGLNLGKNVLQKVKKLTTEFRSANQRMHNKTFIVDGKVVITGGRNIADEYFDYDHEYNFRDRDVLLLGGVSGEIQESFNEFWTDSLSVPARSLVDEETSKTELSNSYNRLHEYACNPYNFWPQIRDRIENLPNSFSDLQSSGKLAWVDSVTFVSDIPGKNDTKRGLGGGGRSTDALIALVKTATTTLDIQSPYLITTELSRGLFKAAIDKGVRVRILTNSLASTDNLEAFNGYLRNRKDLLKIGVEIYEFRPDAAERYRIMTRDLQEQLDFTPIFGFHAKTMVVDEKVTVIGTFNLDPRSANLNTECITVIHSEKVTANVLKGIEEEFKPENSWRITKDFNPDDKVSKKKRFKTWTRKIVPKGIL